MDCSQPGSSVHVILQTRILELEKKKKEYWSGCHFILQEIFPTQGLNPGLLHCRQTLYQLSHQGNQISLSTNIYQAKASDNIVRDIKSVR